VIRRFRNAIIALWPDAIVGCHGQTATGTCLPTRNIDLVVLHQPGDTVLLLIELQRHLESLKVFQMSEVIGRARVPITKGVGSPFGFCIDISSNSESGALNVERTRHLLATCPMIYPLLLFAKPFLVQHRLDEPFHGCIGSNTLLHMVIFIIQSSPLTANYISDSCGSRSSRHSARRVITSPPGSQHAATFT
jgi:DNA polymerase sigma